MPIIIPNNLSVAKVLKDESIFVMNEERALTQDVRQLKILILNLMPIKTTAEIQLLRLLSSSPLQIDITLTYPTSHICKNTSEEYLFKHYETFDDIKDKKFDGMIITGAPVEKLEFEDVDYWEELVKIMDWSAKNVYSTFHICWAAQAGLYHHFGIPKYSLPQKMFGIFPHVINKQNEKLLQGFDDVFYAPHSRCTEVLEEDIKKVQELKVLAKSSYAGVYIVATKDGRQIFITGHSEYNTLTLKDEYIRDIFNGIRIDIPQNYFSDYEINKTHFTTWRGNASLLFSNWLNYYVYQGTPYDLNKIS